MRLALALVALLILSVTAFTTPAQPVLAQDLDFGEAINLSKTGNAIRNPEIALSENNVYVTWTESFPFTSGTTRQCCMA
ncbi:MAG: hypothetical protein ACRD3Z_00090, partial [Nitrososphaerales archaeon]